MFERTDEDAALGLLRFELGGQEVVLSTLPWEASDEWQAKVRTVLGEWTSRDIDDLDSVIDLIAGAMGQVVELVADYDRDHKLGRDAADLRRRYDRTQLYEVFKAIARHEFPFTRDAEGLGRMVLPILRPLLAQATLEVASRLGSSSSSPSPSGDSTPEPSESVSIARNSASSGKQARSA